MSRCDVLRTAVIAALLAVAMPGRAEAATPSVVRVYPTAVVTSDQVTLKDIAELNGEDAQIAGTWPITEAPVPGKQVTVEQAAIQNVLIRRGINASNWVFRGSTRCQISRPMTARKVEAESGDTIAENNRTRVKALRVGREFPTTLPAADSPINRYTAPDPNTLEGAIYQHVSTRLGGLEGRPCVRMSAAQQELLKLAQPSYEFRITDRGGRLLGIVPLEIAIYRQGKLDQIQSLLAEVSLIRSVVVANATINSGETINSEDIILREQSFEQPNQTVIGDLSAVVGQRATRFINKSEPITGKDFEPVPLIVRNDLVTVTVRRGNISIKAVAKAMGSACYGQTIELRNEASKEAFVARVTGLKTAEVVCAVPAPAAVAMAQSASAVGGAN